MYTSTSKEEAQTENVIKVRNHNLEQVNNFKYLGATITENNEILAEIKERITAGNKAYYSSYNMLKNKNISRKTKKNIYKTIIRPVVTYGSETWTLTKSAETVLNTWERKVLRKIFGPTKDENGWRMRTNKEVYDLYKDPTIVAEIKKRADCAGRAT